jgi:hypothetical protein
MMFTELDASQYKYNKVFFNTEFEELLSKIISCYNLMLEDNVTLTNDENLIRDALLINYLRNNNVRKLIDLTDYLFDREVPEDTTIGRTDIKIQTINTFQDTGAYYTIECKRLDATNPDGKTGLNAKYIENGIQRFVLKTYSSHYETNGMIGFVVQKLDIHKNTQAINSLLMNEFKHITTTLCLTNKILTPNFDHSYYSTHDSSSDKLVIYHLMLDFSESIR